LEFREILATSRETIREAWSRSIVEGYHAETKRFLANKRDRFDNPVGYIIDETVDSVLDGLVAGAGAAELSPCLHPLIRIRAVQDFSPSAAISFVLDLKRVVREALGEDTLANGGNEARERFEATVDRMALASFDYYIECRERIHHVKEDELKRNLHMILRQANALERRGG
jgi:hypothetical protein